MSWPSEVALDVLTAGGLADPSSIGHVYWAVYGRREAGASRESEDTRRLITLRCSVEALLLASPSVIRPLYTVFNREVFSRRAFLGGPCALSWWGSLTTSWLMAARGCLAGCGAV